MPKPAYKPVIAIDIDEVLTPHFEDLMNWYNKTYGTKLTLANNHPADDDVSPWGVTDMYAARRRVHAFFETSEFKKAEPYREAVQALKSLDDDHDLVVVTSRDYMIEDLTKQWLDEHFKKMFKDVHFTARYSVEGKGRSKANVCMEIGADVLIDDSLEQAKEAAVKGIAVLLFGSYPWNQADELPKGIVRVKNWQEVLDYFDGKA